MANRFRVIVDSSRCIGAGRCVGTAPQVFDQSDGDGTVVLLQAEPPPALHDDVTHAALLCPARAIAVEDLD
jgi:ferredoxin